jgi:hypothetical protein
VCISLAPLRVQEAAIAEKNQCLILLVLPCAPEAVVAENQSVFFVRLLPFASQEAIAEKDKSVFFVSASNCDPDFVVFTIVRIGRDIALQNGKGRSSSSSSWRRRNGCGEKAKLCAGL